ncbi:putative polysaccharide biosynthesis protein [Alkaliphilus crotonatoxidans]
MLKSNKSFLKGAFILAAAGLFAKFLGIFFKIPLQHLLHDEGMGLFGLPYPIYTVLLSVSLIGFPAAISKIISEKIALGDEAGADKVFRVSFFMLLVIGLGSSLFLLFCANTIIRLLDWPQEAYYSVMGLAFAPLLVSIMSAFRGYFQGMQIMHPTAVSQIIEQIGRVVVGLSLAYVTIEMGIGFAAGAASFGATGGALLGTVVLLVYYLKYRKNKVKKGRSINRDTAWAIVKRLTWLALPITIGAVLSSVMGVIDSVIVHSRLIQSGYTLEGATILYGRLTGKATTLMNVPLTFSMAMSASLVPAVSESLSKRRLMELTDKITSGIKTTIIIALPATVGLSLLSEEIVHLLWGSNEAGGDILKIVALNVIFIALAQTLTGILQGMNRVFIPVFNLLIGVLVKLVVSYILLASHLNIIGTVIGTICSYFVIMALNFLQLRRLIKFKMSPLELFIKPGLATLVMAACVKGAFHFIYGVTLREAVATLGGIFIGGIIYFVVLYLTGAIDFEKRRLF